MARLNPRRRRLAAQAKVIRDITLEHGKAHDDSYLLQQGPVRSSYNQITEIAPQDTRTIAYRSNARPDGFTPDRFIGKGGKLTPQRKPMPAETLRQKHKRLGKELVTLLYPNEPFQGDK